MKKPNILFFATLFTLGAAAIEASFTCHRRYGGVQIQYAPGKEPHDPSWEKEYPSEQECRKNCQGECAPTGKLYIDISV